MSRTNETTEQCRLEENGSLQFHKGTEDELAQYVIDHATMNDPESVIKTVDEYCWNTHWMMHVGDKKGDILDNAIKQYQPKTILELGTYCGYSAIRMAKFLPEDGKLYTIDPSPTNCSQVLIKCAGLQNKITCLTGFANDVIPKLVQLQNKVDLVFIDHAKTAYLPDLQTIEKCGLLHHGSVVVADNVLIFKINDYLNHVRNSGLYSSSVNYVATLEYDDSKAEDMVDGIEVSVWK